MNSDFFGERYELFVTPVWRVTREQSIDNKQLEQAIKHQRNHDLAGTQISNRGGWQSQMYLFKEESFLSLVEYIIEKAEMACRDWGFDLKGFRPSLNTLWANVNRGSDVNESHHHWGFPLQNFNILSGAYYVKCDEKSGAISFLDERPSSKFVMDHSMPLVAAANRFIGQQVTIKPLEGDLLLFPSWLEHKVAPNQNEQERITMSFNISLPLELTDRIHGSKQDQRE